MDLNNKSSIGLLLDAGHMAALNLVHTVTATATATAVLPQLAEAVANGVSSNVDGIALGIREGIAVVSNGNLRLLAKLSNLADRKEGESAEEFFQRCRAEDKAAEKKEAENKKEEVKEKKESSIGFNKDGSF